MRLRVVVASVALGAQVCLLARPVSAAPFPTPVEKLGADTMRAFGGYQFIYFSAAIASTAVMSSTGADHEIRVAVQENIHAPLWGDAAFYSGYVIPVAVPVGIYVTGLLANDAKLGGAGSAAIEAVGLTLVTTIVGKIATGRPFPMHGGDPEAPDRLEHPEYAKEWVPFGFAGRYAWPSGHTSMAVSIAASLSAYSGGALPVVLTTYPIAAGISFGMIVGDHHWASDMLAGALIGHAIGWSVGKSFRERSREATPSASRFQVVPLVGPSLRGAAVVWTM